jgi:uncharacterized protein (DUF1800 family)
MKTRLLRPIGKRRRREPPRLKKHEGLWNFDAATAAFLATTITLLLVAMFATVPNASADKQKKKNSDASSLDKKFKGHLPITELTEDQATLHALNRLAYGPRPGDVERVHQIGLEKWIDEQLNPDSIDDSSLDQRLAKYTTLNMTSTQLLDTFPQPGQLAKAQGLTREQAAQQLQEQRTAARAQAQAQMQMQAQAMDGAGDNADRAQQQLARLQGPGRIVAELSMGKLDRAIYSNRQLEAVMEDFWFNHFNVFAGKGDDRWLLTSYVRDTIRPNTMGKFPDLLLATAKSPAMLFFLDNWMSVDPVAFQQHQQDMGARRARFQGMFEGEPQMAGANAPGAQAAARAKQQERGLNENYGREVMELHTVGVDSGYTQQDVIEMARCLTGWTVSEPRRDPEFVFKPEFHAEGKKVVMGHTFDAGGEKDGEEALKMLANDPRTAKFITNEIARHFVSDNPPPALVARMTENYESTGGDIRSVLKTMIYSPEFWSKEAYRAKVKTPFELVASTARALNSDVTVSLPLTGWVGRMGEPLFLCQPPTGYSDKATTWVNTGALLNRLNFALTFASGKMPGTNVDLPSMFGEDASKDPEMALTRSLDLFLGGEIDPQTRQILESRLADPQILQASLDDPVKQVNEGLLSGLVLGTPEFQRR